MDYISEKLNELLKIIWVIVPAAIVGMTGSLVKYIRFHRQESFSWGEFFSGMVVAAFAGVLVQLICLEYNVGPWLSAASVAMAGYGGGSTIDFISSTLFRKQVR